VDANADGVFDNTTEKFFVENVTTTGPRTVTGSFTMPLTATPGVTGMRIICAEGASGAGLTSCMTYFYGETEDYLVTITLAPPCSGNPVPGNTLASVSSTCPNGVQPEPVELELRFGYQLPVAELTER
jgi:hypothetical protein